MPDPKWRIYYTGGQSFSDLDGSPYDAPAIGVQIIVQREPDVGRYFVAQRDFYWWDEARQFWFGGDQAGFYQYLFAAGPRKVLFGTYVTNREYQDCVRFATNDLDFPPKSARHPEEVF